MAGTKKIKTALVSVFHKDGLDELLAKLNAEGVKFLSTGGTQKFIESLGYDCQAVESVTTYPSILGGRVKTLHPKIFGGILARRDNAGDIDQMKEYDIPSIDPSKAEYGVLLDILNKKGAVTDLADRKMFAERAFGVSSHYDTAIHNWFAGK